MSLPRYHCATPLSIPITTRYYSILFICPIKKLHHRESNPGHKRERLVCYQLHHNGLPYYTPYLSLFLSYIFLYLTEDLSSRRRDCYHPHDPSFTFSTINLTLLLFCWQVSWCSWLSHHFHVVRVPGSNPGGTIFASFPFAIRPTPPFIYIPVLICRGYHHVPPSYLPSPFFL